ncbi:ExbD/TolR family protein [Fibrivirga algicola]|uniref:Biopolymer transporter ExbD n=1 Tax=Fibrivirga algicola TaxID=2950420 RepID=A0ABX0QIA2_9BACT|nr:biopolymer transporter ExbD [Fibrivirga algicola]ARK10471.1 biopolymer transporter ExbD [Fibrella sp. ES10-3-2-2]NID11974.1 biopolymer transporter ExbD [Fibrivirga algicola]
MPKVKVKRASSTVDMTAMCDVAFLLLTFFILTAQFRSQDAAAIETPSSISSIKVPDTDIMTIALDKEGKIYFGVDGQPTRIQMLEYVGEAKGITFSEKEKKEFALMSNFGLPIAQLKSYLSLSKEQQAKVKQPGIPADTTGAGPNNELKDWIYNSRKANNGLRIALKGDNLAKFTNFKNVLSTLQAQNINKFNLITGTEAPPAGWKAD